MWPTFDQKAALYLIAWLGTSIPKSWKETLGHGPALVRMGYATEVEGGFESTPAGVAALSEMARAALRRPKSYLDASERQRWEIDAELGILDWDGT